jgi:hypothetical protein
VEGGPVTQTQEMICGGRYMSGDEALRVFAAGSASNRLRIEVTWRSGKHSVIESAAANQLYEITEAVALAKEVKPKVEPKPLFEDVSARLRHVHREEPYDDFARQPLLSKRLSQLGPGVCWWIWMVMDGKTW